MTLGRRTLAPMPKPGNPKSVLRRCSKSKKIFEEEDYEDVYCEKCGSGEHEDELILCDKCDSGFHLFCLRPVLVSIPKGSWFCKSCDNHKSLKQFPLVQTKIIDFFRIQRSSQSAEKNCPVILKKRKRAGSICTKKRRRRLLPFSPSEDPERRLEQMASLATALTATGAEYSNELTYVSGMAPRSANSPALERDVMQVLSKEDVDALMMCKNMMERGECPPLMVVFDHVEGFTVEADRPIRDLTIVTEYVGDVDYLKNRENDDGDSMMALLYAADPLKSLVICPDKRSNIARFINGINNYTSDGKKKKKCKMCKIQCQWRVSGVAHC